MAEAENREEAEASGNSSREGMTTTTVAGVTVTVTSDSPQPPRAPEVPPRPPVVEKTSVKAVLEKLNDFLTENNLEQQIAEERKMIMQKIEGKNEEILQKKETHRHKLNEVHEAYKREIQKENERHLDDLKVTERGISELRGQLDELEQLQGAVSRQLPGGAPGLATARGEPGGPGRLRDLLECPVCMEEMKPPKKIFQCSNGHVICELCKNNPEVRSCPTCRVKFRGHTVVRNIVAEKLARSTFESDDSDDAPASLNPGPRTTIESNPLGAFRPTREAVVEGEEFHLVGFEPAYGYRRHGGQDAREEEEEEEEDDFLAWARIIGQGEGRETSSPSSNSNQHRRLGEAHMAREECEGEGARGEGNREHAALPRMREAHLIRTYRPNTRYLPHHMRRQRAARGETEEAGELLEQDEQGERLFLRAPRVVRRTEEFGDNPRLFRRVL